MLFFASLCFALLSFALLCFAVICFALLGFALLCFALHLGLHLGAPGRTARAEPIVVFRGGMGGQPGRGGMGGQPGRGGMGGQPGLGYIARYLKLPSKNPLSKA